MVHVLSTPAPQAPNLILVQRHANFEKDAKAHLTDCVEFGHHNYESGVGYQGVQGNFRGVPVIMVYQDGPFTLPASYRWPLWAKQDLGAERIISLMLMPRLDPSLKLGQVVVADSAHLLANEDTHHLIRLAIDLPKGNLSSVPDRVLEHHVLSELSTVGAPHIAGPVLSLLRDDTSCLEPDELDRWQKQGALAQDVMSYAFYLQAKACGVQMVSLGLTVAAIGEQDGDYDPCGHFSVATFAALRTLSELQIRATPF